MAALWFNRRQHVQRYALLTLDTFVLSKDGAPINWTNDGIAWPSDLEAKFINPETPQAGTWIPQVLAR